MPVSERYFLVTSRGQSGSRWLADALSSLDGVACSHGVDPAMVGNGGMHHPVGVGDLFASLSGAQAARAYGNVRCYTLTSLERARADSPPGVPYRVANLVRHPITWIESQAEARAKEMASNVAMKERFEDFYVANRRVCDAFTLPFGVSPLEADSLSFINTALGAWPSYAEDLAWMGVPYIRMEDVTTRPETFKAVVAYLVGDAIRIGREDLKRIYAPKALSAEPRWGHSSPRHQFEAWPEWKRHAIGLIWETRPEVRGFGRLGYDFGFLEELRSPSSQPPELRSHRMSA